MSRKNLFWCILSLFLTGTLHAGVVTFTDIDAFFEAAGNVQVIDFSVLPDGSPSYSGALITPEFNYTDWGVEFSSNHPDTAPLQIVGDAEWLCACPINTSDPNRNWIIAEFVEPVTAIGILFGGDQALTIYSERTLLASRVFGGSGFPFFLGLISDEPIISARIDAGDNTSAISSFYFSPVPEPATLLLLGVGAFAVLRRRK